MFIFNKLIFVVRIKKKVLQLLFHKLGYIVTRAIFNFKIDKNISIMLLKSETQHKTFNFFY